MIMMQTIVDRLLGGVFLLSNVSKAILCLVSVRKNVLHSILVWSVLMTFSLGSCSPYSAEVQRTLSLAGDNQGELMAVLDHFSKNEGDSLKLQAAEFLIVNMYWHTNTQSEIYDDYFSELEEIYSLRPDSVSISPLEDSLLKKATRPYMPAERKYDSQVITSTFLINHIDRMFEIRDSSMCQEVPFDVFCDYVLPYRVWREKTNIDWIDMYRNKAHQLLERNMHLIQWDSLHLSDLIVRSIKHNYHVSSVDMQEMAEGYPPSFVMKMKRGTCMDYANRGCYYFRSLGIPTAIDIVPQWGNQHGSHEWTSFLMDSVCHYSSERSDFSMSGNIDESQGHHIDIQRSKNKEVPKIYRISFSVNPKSLALSHGQEPVPPFFMSPFIHDVTDLYINDCTDVELNVPSRISSRFVYLSIFNNQEWKPVAWAENRNHRATFIDMSPNVVYMLTSYDGNKMQSCGDPFLLQKGGEIKYFIPDTINREHVVLTRKYKITERVMKSQTLLGNGRIELSNDSSFENPYVAYSFPDTVAVQFHYVPICVSRPYRYVRFLGGKNKHGGEIAEMVVLGNDGRQLSGRPITNRYVHWKQPVELAFDKDPLTYFRSGGSGHGCCGLDLGSPQRITEVDILPRNDGNYIQEGDLYELFYWSNGQWRSLGQQRGPRSQSLEYDSVPSQSLLLLRDLTKGKEERIFTYEGEKQVWW